MREGFEEDWESKKRWHTEMGNKWRERREGVKGERGGELK